MKSFLLLWMISFVFTTAKAQTDSVPAAVPVSLQPLQVQPVDKVVLLKWAVEQSEAYKSFDIERSDENAPFIKVGSKLAISKRNDTGYDFVDATPMSNKVLRYRLKLISKDGLVSYSEVKETVVTDVALMLRLIQNPVRSQIEFEVEVLAAMQATVAVMSNAGQQIREQTFRLTAGKNKLSLPATGIGQGIYQLIVEAGRERKTISFIKE